MAEKQWPTEKTTRITKREQTAYDETSIEMFLIVGPSVTFSQKSDDIFAFKTPFKNDRRVIQKIILYRYFFIWKWKHH